jgi:uncharacterized cupin superfamily protein
MNVVNLSELAYEKDHHGVRFGVERAVISDRLDARKLRYEFRVVPPGRADGPLRFHLVSEHMLLVLGGEPSLRLGALEHLLGPGDVAAILPRASLPWQILNRTGAPAHVFVAGTRDGRDVIGFPESGKRIYRVRESSGERAVQDVIMRDDRVVDLWDGEPVDRPVGPPRPAPAARDPHIAALEDAPWEAFGRTPFRGERKRLAREVGAERLGYSLYRLQPGQRPYPFHFHHVNEEFFHVRTGYGQLRARDGSRDLRPGDAFNCPPGPEGAHGFLNTGDAPLVYFALSTMIEPEILEYPDSDKSHVLVGAPPGGDPRERSVDLVVRRIDAVEREEGER